MQEEGQGKLWGTSHLRGLTQVQGYPELPQHNLVSKQINLFYISTYYVRGRNYLQSAPIFSGYKQLAIILKAKRAALPLFWKHKPSLTPLEPFSSSSLMWLLLAVVCNMYILHATCWGWWPSDSQLQREPLIWSPSCNAQGHTSTASPIHLNSQYASISCFSCSDPFLLCFSRIQNLEAREETLEIMKLL